MLGRISVTMTLVPADDGSLNILVSPLLDNEYLRSRKSAVLLTFWLETETVVRGTIKHPASGAQAHFQSTADLITLAQALSLSIERSPAS